jgi:inosine-uridine nucleoside N-ribohydrolase
VRLWIDTDVGTNPDDAIALVLACVHPDVTLMGVSTVGGDEEERASVARRLLATAGHDGVPVIAGPELEPGRVADAGSEALLAIGPLTNVARMVERGTVPGRLALMGGVRGRVLHRGEWREVETNFGADPGSAALVVARADPLIVPLDVTADVVLTEHERDRLGVEVPALRDDLARWVAPVCLHDPLALFAVAGEPFISVGRARLRVDERGRLVDASDGAERRVVVAADRDAAIARTFQLVGRERR